MITARWLRATPRAGEATPSVAFVGRLVLAVGSVGTLFALLGLLTSWPIYSSPGLVLLAWLLTGSVLPATVWSVKRRGILTGRMLAGLAAALYLIDVVVPLTVPQPLRIGSPTWNWGAAAIAFLGFAAYRRARDVIGLAAIHAAIGLVYAFVGVDPGSVDLLAVVVLVSGCLLPPVVAAQFLGRYAQALRVRHAAVEVHRSMLSGKAAEDDGRQLIMDRVSLLRGQMLILFDAVANGAAVPLDGATRAQAQDLAAAVRRELDESRSRGWLLWRPVGDQHRERTPPDVNVSGSPALLDDAARAAVAAVVGLLAQYDDWCRIGLTITPTPQSGAKPSIGTFTRDAISVTLVAEGRSAVVAAHDQAVKAAAAHIGGTPWQDAEGSLVIEGTLP
jgi:hypothetical protein